MNALGLEVAGLDPSLVSFGWASQHGVGHVERDPDGAGHRRPGHGFAAADGRRRLVADRL